MLGTRLARDVAVGVVGACIIGLTAAYSGSATKTALWLALVAGIVLFVAASFGERRLPSARRARAAKQTLSNWIAFGFNLRLHGTTDTQVLQWTSRLCDLVDEMFGEAERNAFMTHIPGYAGPKDGVQREEWISHCNAALGELVRRADSLTVRSTFDPAEWQV